MTLSRLGCTSFVHIIEFSFNSNEFGRVLLVIPSMFGKLEVHASEVVWRFEPITFYIGELRVKLVLAMHAVFYFEKPPSQFLLEEICICISACRARSLEVLPF